MKGKLSLEIFCHSNADAKIMFAFWFCDIFMHIPNGETVFIKVRFRYD